MSPESSKNASLLLSISDSNCKEGAPANDRSSSTSLTISQHKSLGRFVHVTTVSTEVASTSFLHKIVKSVCSHNEQMQDTKATAVGALAHSMWIESIQIPRTIAKCCCGCKMYVVSARNTCLLHGGANACAFVLACTWVCSSNR